MDVKVGLFSKEMSSYSVKEGWRWQDRPLQSRAFMGTGGQRGRYHESCSNHCIPEWAMRYAKIFQLLSIVTWLLWYWNNGANRLELKGREAKQLAREGGNDNDKAIGKVAQAFTIWRWLLSGVKERYPFKEDVICSRQLKFHKERYSVLEGISHAGGDLWWPGQQPVIQRFRWSQVQVTHVAEVCTEHSIAVCQFNNSWMANSSNMKKVSLSLQVCV